jgi:hypothetical protein
MGAVGKGCCDDEYAVLGVGCARMGGGVSMWGLSGAVDCEAGFDAVGVSGSGLGLDHPESREEHSVGSNVTWVSEC